MSEQIHFFFVFCSSNISIFNRWMVPASLPSQTKWKFQSETVSLVDGIITKSGSQTLNDLGINILICLKKSMGNAMQCVHSNRSLIVGGTIIQRLANNSQSRQYILKVRRKKVWIYLLWSRDMIYSIFFFFLYPLNTNLVSSLQMCRQNKSFV